MQKWRKPLIHRIRTDYDCAFDMESENCSLFYYERYYLVDLDGGYRTFQTDSILCGRNVFFEAIWYALCNKLDDLIFEYDTQILINCIKKTRNID